MADQDVTWGVVATVHEPLPMVAAFVAYHLEMGASEIWLFFDQPNPEGEALLSRYPNVRAVQCDERFWEKSAFHKRRYVQIERRQRANFTYAQAHSDVLWLAHIDCDEFVSDMPNTIPQIADLPATVNSVQMPVRESVIEIDCNPQTTVYPSSFRAPFADNEAAVIREIYGDNANLLKRGLSGYVSRKCLYRVGSGLRFGLHAPLPRPIWEQKPETEFPKLSNLNVYHFDSLSFHAWCRKLRSRIRVARGIKGSDTFIRGHTGRSHQVRTVLTENGVTDSASDIFHGVRGVSAKQIELLKSHGQFVRADLSIVPIAEDYFPELRGQYVPEAFEREFERFMADEPTHETHA